jgi:hypothetical protein
MALTEGRYNNLEGRTLQVMFRDANGYPQGVDTTPDTISTPATSSAYLVPGLIDVTPNTPTFPVVTNQGGGEIINKTPVSAIDYGVPTFTLSQRDETLESFISASTLDLATNTARAQRGWNVTRTTFPSFMVVFGTLVTLASGVEHWDHYIFPNCTIRKTGEAGMAQVTGDVTNPNPFTYALDLSLATRDIDGMPYSSKTVALTGNKDARFYHRAASRLAYTTFNADGVDTSFILGYRPVNTDATGAAENNIALNGVQQAVTSVTLATGVVDITSPGAGSDGDIYTVEYETDFIAI